MRLKFFRLAALLLSVVLILCSCAPIVQEQPEEISIYATFYPIYALSSMVVKDIPDLELHCLVQPQDGCLRSYELSDWDLYLLAYSADGILAGGSGLESFEDMLQSISGSIALSEVLYGLELYQGDIGESDGESHFAGENPHLYLSVDGAMQLVENIAGSMSVLDARYAELYEKNLSEALERLTALKEEIQRATAHLTGQKVALLNEALIYPALEYGLEVSAWIERESGAGMYSAELDSCLENLRLSGAQVVLIERQAPETLVQALEDEGYAVARMDTLSTRGENDGSEGYFEAQRENARAVSEAFEKIMKNEKSEGIN